METLFVNVFTSKYSAFFEVMTESYESISVYFNFLRFKDHYYPMGSNVFLENETFKILTQHLIHSSDMSIIHRFLTNQIAANEIIIVTTPYCPTPQHLLHMQGVNLLSLMTFGESKCHVYLNSL